uniref:Uncharacterized protein n=1 Tax=Oryza glumipatula TaxID=40148 RepID=A0A0E0BDA5_9ORYZ
MSSNRITLSLPKISRAWTSEQQLAEITANKPSARIDRRACAARHGVVVVVAARRREGGAGGARRRRAVQPRGVLAGADAARVLVRRSRVGAAARAPRAGGERARRGGAAPGAGGPGLRRRRRVAVHRLRRRVGAQGERLVRGRRGLGAHRRPPPRRRPHRRRRPRRRRRRHRATEGEPGQGGGAADRRGGGRQVRPDRRRRRRRRRHRLLHRRVAQAQPRGVHGGRARGAPPRAADELRPVDAADHRARPRPLLRQRRRRLAGPGLPRLLRDRHEEVLEIPHQRRQGRHRRQVHRRPAGLPRQHPLRRRGPLLDRHLRREDAAVGRADEVAVREEAGVHGGQVRRGGAPQPEERRRHERDARRRARVDVQRPRTRPHHRLAQGRRLPLLRLADQTVPQQDRPRQIAS